MNTTPILRATNIVKKLGGKTILNDVSLDVHKGDVKFSVAEMISFGGKYTAVWSGDAVCSIFGKASVEILLARFPKFTSMLVP